MPAEFYGILSRLILIGCAVFDVTQLEYTRSKKKCQFTGSGITTRPRLLNFKMNCAPIPVILCFGAIFAVYEGPLISNAHSKISRKREHVFKQRKVGSKVQYFSYKLTYLFFGIVVLSFNTFFPT